MFFRLIIFLTTICVSYPAQAGPWLREKGTAFTAVSFATTYYLETASQTYLEYGLTDTTTMIADIGMARLHFAPDSGYATLSMRRSLGPTDAPSKWAYEIGVGVAWIGPETLPHIRTGLSWGKGTKWGEKSGWMTVEGAVIWNIKHALHAAKLDATIGINFTDTTSGMIQIFTAHVADQGIVTFAPSIIFSPKKSKFRFQIGAESELGNLGNSALKIGLWREF